MLHPKVRRLKVLVLVLASLLQVPAARAASVYAEGKNPQDWSWNQRMDGVEAAFVGEVLFQGPVSPDESVFFFLVEKAWKGENRLVVARGTRAICGRVSLANGERTVAFLYRSQSGQLSVSESLLWKEDVEATIAEVDAAVGPPIWSRELTDELRQAARRGARAAMKAESTCIGSTDASALALSVDGAKGSWRKTEGAMTLSLDTWRTDRQVARFVLNNQGPCWLNGRIEGEIAGAKVSLPIALSPWALEQRIVKLDPGGATAGPEGCVTFTWLEGPLPPE